MRARRRHTLLFALLHFAAVAVACMLGAVHPVKVHGGAQSSVARPVKSASVVATVAHTVTIERGRSARERAGASGDAVPGELPRGPQIAPPSFRAPIGWASTPRSVPVSPISSPVARGPPSLG